MCSISISRVLGFVQFLISQGSVDSKFGGLARGLSQAMFDLVSQGYFANLQLCVVQIYSNV